MDKLEVELDIAGESKNCLIYEPEEGGDIVSKVYIRKSVFGVTSAQDAPKRLTFTVSETE